MFEKIWGFLIRNLFFETKILRTIIVLWVTFWVTVIGLVGFTAYHFIHKYW